MRLSAAFLRPQETAQEQYRPLKKRKTNATFRKTVAALRRQKIFVEPHKTAAWTA